MVTISSLWFMILIELLIATTLLSVLLIVFSVMRRLRDRRAAAEIVQKVKEDEARRTAETKKIMRHRFGFDDGKSEELAVRIDHEERAFYQNAINMYLRRDASALASLNITFEAAVDHYRTLQPPGGSGSAKPVNESGELKRLKDENKRLSEEISVTMQTMGRMLSEYSAMFAEKAKEQEEEGQEEQYAHEEPEPTPVQDETDTPDDEIELPSDVGEGDAGDVAQPDQQGTHLGSAMVEEMDDLSDLDPQEETDLKEIEAPENPDELIG